MLEKERIIALHQREEQETLAAELLAWLEESQADLAEQQQQSKQLQTELDAIDLVKTSLEQKNEELLCSIRALQEKIEQQTLESYENETRLAELQKACEKFEEEKVVISQQNEAIQEEIALHRQHLYEQRALAGERLALVQDAQNQLVEQQQLTKRLQIDLDSLDQAKLSVKQENDQILEAYLALQEEMETWLVNNQEKDAQLAALQETCNRLEEERAILLQRQEAARTRGEIVTIRQAVDTKRI